MTQNPLCCVTKGLSTSVVNISVPTATEDSIGPITNRDTRGLVRGPITFVPNATSDVPPPTAFDVIFGGTGKHLRQKQRTKRDLNQLLKHALRHQQSKRHPSQKLGLSNSDAGAALRYSTIDMTCICMAGGNIITNTVEPYRLDHGVVMK